MNDVDVDVDVDVEEFGLPAHDVSLPGLCLSLEPWHSFSDLTE